MKDFFDNIYDNFKRYYPNVEERAVEYFEKGPYELIVRLDNGTMLSYDDLEKSTRVLPSDPNVMGEEQFRREFARRLRRQMYLKGVTQMQLANGADISEVSLSNYMTGKSTPSFFIVDKLAKVLKCHVDDLRYDLERYE